MFLPVLKMSGQSNNTLQDSIKNDSLQNNIFRQHFLNSGNLKNLPFRDVKSVSLIYSSAYYLKGNRMFYDGIEANGDYIYIDGMQVSDGGEFPFRSIGSYQFYNNNGPINMGNSAAGFIDIKSPEAADKFGFNIEALNTFSGLNEYELEFNLNAPIRLNKDKPDKKPVTVFVAGNYFKTNNNDPIWENCYVAKAETLEALRNNPLIPTGLSSRGTFYSSEYVRMKDIETCKSPEYNGRYAFNAFAKINIPINSDIKLSIGNYSKIENRDVFVFENALFNSINNPERYTRNFDNYLKFEHEIINTGNFSIGYNVFMQYSNYFSRTQSRIHKDRLFEYGYLGKFKTYKMPVYYFPEEGIDLDGEHYDNVWVLGSWDLDTAYTFQNLNYNPDVARYTEMIYELYPDKWGDFPIGQGNWMNSSNLQANGGMLNGYYDIMDCVYGMWNNAGSINNRNSYTIYDQLNVPHNNPLNYSENSSEKIRGVFQFKGNYNSHNFTAGFEYLKKIKRSYIMNPVKLWTRMRQLTNFHISELDLYNPVFVYDNNGIFQDTILFYRYYNETIQNNFDRNLRKKLGLPVDGLDYILTDSYDMVNNTIDYYDKDGNLHTVKVDEDLFTLDMFSPDELTYNSVVNYMGYDHTGKKLNHKSGAYDFFTDWSVDAFRPVYYSGYIEDKFKIKKFNFSIGLRLDVFDANQPALKDPFLLFPAYNVGESNSAQAKAQYPDLDMEHPDNIGDDYYIYVNSTNEPVEIVGYRNGFAWYNEDGLRVSDISALGSETGPLLVDRSQQRSNQIDERSFTDYKPAFNILPQINIDYTISKNTQVYFNYNSYSQNPDFYNEFRLDLYYYLDNYISVTNPALKPLRVDKLNIGLKQRIYKKLYFDGDIFVNSIKNYYYYDLVYGAYPRDYYTLLNYDTLIFSKGFMGSLNYFSSKTSGLNLSVSATKFITGELYTLPDVSKYPNYHETSDLIINASAGFNFGIGREYVGPVANDWKILEDFGMSVYYQFRKGIISHSYIRFHDAWESARTPDFNMVNLKLEKGFYLKDGSGINIYLLIENLFNFKNVFYVYPQTGEPDDDGYLSDPAWQDNINSHLDPQSYRDLYSLHLKNPNHYGSPRIVKAGFILHF